MEECFLWVVCCEGGAILVDDFTIRSGCHVVCDNGKLSLGTGFVNFSSTILCRCKITIGKDVAISHHVIIRDSDAHRMLYDGYESTKEICIGNHVWIGARAIILKGVTLGDGCVVAAGSVVTKSFPPKSLIGGVPARILKSNIEWTL